MRVVIKNSLFVFCVAAIISTNHDDTNHGQECNTGCQTNLQEERRSRLIAVVVVVLLLLLLLLLLLHLFLLLLFFLLAAGFAATMIMMIMQICRRNIPAE